MDDGILQRLLTDLESDRVERKASIADKEKICQAICAFANDLPQHRKPGVIVIGARDDGSPSGVPVTDRLLQDLADLRSNGNIHPFPSLTVQKRSLDQGEVAVVVVEPSDAPPVRYKGRTWIRVGPRRDVATAEEEGRLAEKRRARDLPFDLSPVGAAALADLDLDLFRRVYLPSAVSAELLQQYQRSLELQLASLQLATPGDPPTPTMLGILLLGKDPRQFFPGAYVQFLRIDGVGLTDPITDQKEIDGPLPELLPFLDETLQINISVASQVAGRPRELRQPNYPLTALQQLTNNALLHRTYQGTHAPVRVTWFRDRIEIQNPGGPYGQVTRSNFGTPGVTDYRNPHLAAAMKNLGWVQRFGLGIPLAQKALADNGNPPCEFVVEESHVLATVRTRP